MSSPKAVERRDLRRRRLGRDAAQGAGGPDQRAGLAPVDRDELRQGEASAARPRGRATGRRPCPRCRPPGTAPPPSGRAPRAAGPSSSAAAGQHPGRHRHQQEADPGGGGHVERAVGGGPAAAQVVVVHAGQIVVHQRVGVHRLDRRGHAGDGGRRAADRAVGRQHQRGAHPLARRAERVRQRLAVPAADLGLEPLGPATSSASVRSRASARRSSAGCGTLPSHPERAKEPCAARPFARSGDCPGSARSAIQVRAARGRRPPPRARPAP